MNLSGPQGDREKYWSRNRKSFHEDIGKSNKEAFEQSEIELLRAENESYKDQLRRALKELKEYQIKYPSPFVATSDEDQDAFQLTINPSVINPLFEAYDCRINELEDMLKNQVNYIELNKKKVTDLILENEKLYEDLKNATNTSGTTNLEIKMLEQTIYELKEKSNNLFEENGIISNQKILLTQELDQLQEILAQKVSEIDKFKELVKNLEKKCFELENNNKILKKESEENLSKAMEVSLALGKVENNIEEYIIENNILKTKEKEQENLISNLKNQLRDREAKKNDEEEGLFYRVKKMDEYIKEIQQDLHTKNIEYDQLNEQYKKLKNEYKSTRQDAEGMLQVMSGMEKQLNEYNIREEQVSKLNAESKELMMEAISIKEQYIVREEQHKLEIERLLNERKTYQLNRQNEISKAIESTKQQVQVKISALENELNEMTQRNSKLIFESDRSNREAKSTREMFDKLQRVYEDQQKNFEEQLASLSQQLQSMSLSKESETLLRLEVQENNTELRQIIDKYRQQFDSLQLLISNNDKKNNKELLECKNTIKNLNTIIKKHEFNIEKLNKLNKDIEENNNKNNALLENKYKNEIELLKKKINEYETNYNLIENANELSDNKLVFLVDQLKDDYSAQIKSLESRLNAEIDKTKTLTSHNRNLNQVIEEHNIEKVYFQDFKKNYSELGLENERLKETIAGLTYQINEIQKNRDNSIFNTIKTVEDSFQMLSPSRPAFSSTSPPSSPAYHSSYITSPQREKNNSEFASKLRQSFEIN